MRLVSSFAVGLIVFAGLSAGCASPTSPTGPRDFTLAPGAAATYGGLTVRFVDVIVDSRCPADALCIQAGDAFVAIDAATARSAGRYETQVQDPDRRRIRHEGYVIDMKTLEPYPFVSGPIDRTDYRLTFTVAAG